MTKDVKILIKRNHIFICFIFIVIFGTLIMGCAQKEKIYLDYDEVMSHSFKKEMPEKNTSFRVQNADAVILLARTEKEITIRTMDYLNKIKITPIDTAINKLSKITLDNLHIEEEKGLPQIFIVKKDTLENKLKIFKVGQTFSVSEDNFDF